MENIKNFEQLRNQNRLFKVSKDDIKATKQQLNRRGVSLFKKALELSILCSVDAYIVIRDGNRLKIFNSDIEKPWVPSQDQLVAPLSITLPTKLTKPRRNIILSQPISVRQTLVIV